MKRIKNLLTFLIGWPFSLIALYFIAKTFLPKLNQIHHLLSSVNIPLLLIGFICFLLYFFVRSIIWQFTLRLLGYDIPYNESAFLWSTSEFKRYIPGNIWSFIGRTMLFSEKGVTKKNLARALLIEMQIIFLGCIIVSFLSLPFVFRFIFHPGINLQLLYVLVYILILTGILLYMYHENIITRAPQKLKKLLTYMLPSFSVSQNFWLLFSGILAVFFFGLGYYFIISSIITLDLRLIISLSGFFALSFLIGLLSLITPTGLGVREGSITLGLSKLVALDIAGFASFFGRIVLILCEISFILFSFLLTNFNNKKYASIQKFITEHIAEILLGIFIVIFCLYFSTANVLRHNNFYTGRFDLGNMDQTIWNTLHGNIFQFTNPDGTNIESRLAFHADFILILFTPLYIIWDDPRMLLIAQTVIVGLGAIYIYLLSKEILKNHTKIAAFHIKLVSLAFAFSYLLNPSIQWAILYDFHGVTLATTFLVAAFYYLYKKRYVWFLLFAILSGITKEQVWIPVAFMGLYIAVVNNNWQVKDERVQLQKATFLFGGSVFLISLFIFYYLMWHAIPASTATKEHFALSYFSEDNDSPSTLIKSVLLNPQKTITKLLQPERMFYLRELFEPIGYLSILAPWFIIFPIADIILNILSDKPELHQIYYQYSAVITPFLYIGAIYGISLLLRLLKKIPVGFYALYISIFAIFTANLYGPLPWSEQPNIDMFTKPQPNREYITDKLKKIPEKYSIAATNNIGAHLAHRKYLYTFPFGAEYADVMAILITPNSTSYEKNLVTQFKTDRNYKIAWEKEGFIVFEKKEITL